MSPSHRPTLQACLEAGRNNLDFLRFAAAAGVIVSHAFVLGEGPRGTPEPVELFSHRQLTLGYMCVAAFLTISGVLITRSWERGRDAKRFLWARVLRIFPGLAVSLLLTVFVLGAAFTRHSLGAYLTSPDTLRYLARNLTLNDPQWTLPGVFEANAYPGAVNGALWTLKYEFGFYLLVLGLGLTNLLRREWMLAGWVLSAVLSFVHIGRLGLWPDVFLYFGGGCVLYLWRDRVRMSPWLALACAAALVVTSYAGVGARVALGACGSYLVLYLAFLPGRLNGFGRRGDFSYGIYLYGFPLQQTATALMGGWMPWWMNAAAGFCLALLAAALSWHLVEKPALSLKDSPSRAARPIEMGKAS